MRIVIDHERPVSWNKYWSGMHWTQRNNEAKRVHALVKYSKKYMSEEDNQVLETPRRIIVTAYFDKRAYDPDNIAAKPYIDGLKGWYLKDDTMKYVDEVTTRSRIDKKNPRVEIEILL